jgi:hypothetical protein
MTGRVTPNLAPRRKAVIDTQPRPHCKSAAVNYGEDGEIKCIRCKLTVASSKHDKSYRKGLGKRVAKEC